MPQAPVAKRRFPRQRKALRSPRSVALPAAAKRRGARLLRSAEARVCCAAPRPGSAMRGGCRRPGSGSGLCLRPPSRSAVFLGNAKLCAPRAALRSRLPRSGEERVCCAAPRPGSAMRGGCRRPGSGSGLCLRPSSWGNRLQSLQEKKKIHVARK